MEDHQLIEMYWKRDPNAIEETQLRYGAYCFAIADNILKNMQDSEECVSDTWYQTWNAIPPQRPHYFRIFLGKITRNLAFNRYAARNAAKRGGGELTLVLEELAECIADESDVEDTYLAKALGQSIREFVRKLPEKEGNLFIRRYFYTESVAVIARRYGLTSNHVMVTLSRTRKKLKEHLKKEGYIL